MSDITELGPMEQERIDKVAADYDNPRWTRIEIQRLQARVEELEECRRNNLSALSTLRQDLYNAIVKRDTYHYRLLETVEWALGYFSSVDLSRLMNNLGFEKCGCNKTCVVIVDNYPEDCPCTLTAHPEWAEKE